MRQLEPREIYLHPDAPIRWLPVGGCGLCGRSSKTTPKSRPFAFKKEATD